MKTPDTRFRRKSLVLALVGALALGTGASAGAGGLDLTLDLLPAADGTLLATPMQMNVPAKRPAWLGDRIRRAVLQPNGVPATPVTTCADDGSAGSLRSVIAAAAEGDTIDMSGLACSTISLATGAIEVAQKDLTIVGPGREALTIDAGGTSRVFELSGKYSASDPNHGIYLSGFTIANGYATSGGGCIQSGANLGLADMGLTGCKVDNSGAAGGGAISTIANVFLVQSVVSGNQVRAQTGEASGGAINAFKYVTSVNSAFVGNVAVSQGGTASGGAISAGSLRFYGGGLANNQAGSYTGIAQGGAVFVLGEEVSTRGMMGPGAAFFGSVLLQNRAAAPESSAYGGAVAVGARSSDPGGHDRWGAVYLFQSTVGANQALSTCTTGCRVAGGGVSVLGTVAAYGSTIARNGAGFTTGTASGWAYGGGLAVLPDTPAGAGEVAIGQSTLEGNVVGGAGGHGVGGASASFSGPTTVQFSTISGNQAKDFGGGMALTSDLDGETHVEDTIIAGNQAPNGPDMAAPPLSSATVQGDYNLIREVSSNVTLPGDTIDADPKLAPLAANGGPTPTMALCTGSPAIDAGSIGALRAAQEPGNAAGPLPAGGFPLWDQRDNPYVRVSGPYSDIGAFEVQPDPERIFWNGFEPPLDPCAP